MRYILCLLLSTIIQFTYAQKSVRTFPSDAYGKGGKTTVYRGEKLDSIIIKDPKGIVRGRTVKLPESSNEIREEQYVYDSTGKLINSSVRTVDALGKVSYTESRYKDGLKVGGFTTDKTPDNQLIPETPSRFDGITDCLNPFRKGVTHLRFNDMLRFNSRSDYANDNKTGSKSSLRINPWTGYYLLPGLGFEAGVEVENSKTKSATGGSTTEEKNWEGTLGLNYGWHFSPKFNLYAGLDLNFGKEKTITKTGSTSSTNAADKLGWKF